MHPGHTVYIKEHKAPPHQGICKNNGDYAWQDNYAEFRKTLTHEHSL
jgi:hypothetical protein